MIQIMQDSGHIISYGNQFINQFKLYVFYQSYNNKYL